MMRALRNESVGAFLEPIVGRLGLRSPREWDWKLIGGRAALLVPAFFIFAFGNLIHATLRGVALHVAPFSPVNVAQWDIAVFRGVPSLWMQDVLGTTGFWAEIAFFYWSSLFWLPTLLVGLIVVARGRWYFTRLILLQFALVVSADVIYGIVPSRPPWMDVDVVRIIAAESKNGVHIDRNQFAALPSLHVAVPFVFALWFHAFDKSEPLRRLSPFLFVWALGMGWSVMYTGEHYFIDVVTGYLWAGMVFFVLAKLGVLHARRPVVHDEAVEPTPLSVFDGGLQVERERAA